MRLGAPGILLAALAGQACAAPGSGNEAAQVTGARAGAPALLTPGAGEARLALPESAAAEQRAFLEVMRVTNPDRRPVILVVTVEGGGGGEQRLALYPPDKPARFALRLPRGAHGLRVRIDAGERGPPELVELRAAR